MQTESSTNKDVSCRVDPGNALLVAYIVVVCLLVFFGSFMEAKAQEIQGENQRVDQVKEGSLFFQSDKEGTVTVPSLSQDVNIVVSGMIARVMVFVSVKSIEICNRYFLLFTLDKM